MTGYPEEIVALPSKGHFYPLDNPLSAGQVSMKYMTARDEDLLTSRTLIQKGIVLEKLLQALITTPINYDDLLIGDKNGLIIAARILGYGKDYQVDITCPECEETNSITIDLSTLDEKKIDFDSLPKGVNSFTFTLPLCKKVITFKLLSSGDETSIEQELKALRDIGQHTGGKGKEKAVRIDPAITTRLRYSIIAIDGNATKDAINVFINTELLARDNIELRKYMRSVNPDMDMTFGFNCSDCQHSARMALPMGVEFFWPNIGI